MLLDLQTFITSSREFQTFFKYRHQNQVESLQLNYQPNQVCSTFSLLFLKVAKNQFLTVPMLWNLKILFLSTKFFDIFFLNFFCQFGVNLH